MAIVDILHKINGIGWNNVAKQWEATTVAGYTESIGGAVVEVMDLPDAAVALPSLDPADIHAVCHAWAVEAVARRPGEGGAGALIGDFRVETGAVYTPTP